MFADILEATEDHERLVELADNWNVKQRIIIGKLDDNELDCDTPQSQHILSTKNAQQRSSSICSRMSQLGTLAIKKKQSSTRNLLGTNSSMSCAKGANYTETEALNEEQLEQRRINMRYTQNIDQVFNVNRQQTEGDLYTLKQDIKANTDKFENEFRNLRSYIKDMEELQQIKEAKKSYALEQIP